MMIASLPIRIGLILLGRFCLNTAKKRCWLPRRLYFTTIMDLLKKDDLDGAVSSFLNLYRRRGPTEENLIIRDLIQAEIDIRQRILTRRMDELKTGEKKSFMPLKRFIQRRLHPKNIEKIESHQLNQGNDERKALEEGLRILQHKQALLNEPTMNKVTPFEADGEPEPLP